MFGAGMDTFRYRAFISYSHKDSSAAKWLHKQLEAFPIDKELVGRETALGPIPKALSPVFRDRDDFTAGHSLSEQTLAALDASAALIVVCSPAAAKSHYVNEEIRLFRQRWPERPVIPFIVGGAPNTDAECFPPALRFHVGADGAVSETSNEVLAADWREAGDGRALALAKVVARLIGLSTDDVFRRAERARRRAARIRSAVAASIVALAIGGGATAWLWRDAATVVVSYTAALDRYCQDYLKNFKTECDREDLGATFKRIADAAAAGEDPRNAQILTLIEAGRSAEAAPLMRALAAEEAARGKAQVKRAAQRYRDSGRIAFSTDPKTALADYTRAVELDADEPEGWNRLGVLQMDIGELDGAVTSFKRTLTLASNLQDRRREAAAIGNLGLIYLKRGDLTAAESSQRKSLALSEQLGSKEGMANSYGNLGLIYKKRGDLDTAEAMLKKALAIAEDSGNKKQQATASGAFGHIYLERNNLDAAEKLYKQALIIDEQLDRKENMAVSYNYIGVIYARRGDQNTAKAMFKKSLAIREELGRKQGVAQVYDNLGHVDLVLGELDAAEAMFKKSLAISEELDDKQAMANAYGNLGVTFKTHGNLDAAEAMHKKCLALYKQLANKDGIAGAHGNLGVTYYERNDLDAAEAMIKKALDLYEQLGRKEGMAINYGNLGLIYSKRGHFDEAEVLHKKSLAIHEQVGSKEGMATQNANLGLIAKQRGKPAETCTPWRQASDLYRQIGARPMIKQIEGWMREANCPAN
jgi:tetratricopeptide (TPR) repeat protein